MDGRILMREPAVRTKPHPVVFVHGAWHAAWCWEEYFMAYFTDKGYVTLVLQRDLVRSYPAGAAAVCGAHSRPDGFALGCTGSMLWLFHHQAVVWVRPPATDAALVAP